MNDEPNINDLGGFDSLDAREQIKNVILALKETQRQHKKKAEELKLWENRHKLATQASESELIKAAETRVNELKTEIDKLILEESSLKSSIDVMKGQLINIDIETDKTVDAELLLQEFENVLGVTTDNNTEVDSPEIDNALNELKKKMGL